MAAVRQLRGECIAVTCHGPDDQLAAVTAPTTHLPFAGSPPREGAMERSSLPSIYEVCDDAGVRQKLDTWRERNKGLGSSAKEDPWQYIRLHRGRVPLPPHTPRNRRLGDHARDAPLRVGPSLSAARPVHRLLSF